MIDHDEYEQRFRDDERIEEDGRALALMCGGLLAIAIVALFKALF